MAQPRHLRFAPITEAIIDIRVANSGASARSFESLRGELAKSFPFVEEPVARQATVKIQGGKVQASNFLAPTNGLHFKSPDELTIAQFRADGFTLNRLRPYTSWEELFPEVRRLWPAFFRHLPNREASVKRIATRFINHIRLPIEPGQELGDYLTAPAATPPGAPMNVSSFLSKVVVQDPGTSSVVSITQSLPGNTAPGQVATVLLDIEAFQLDGLSTDIEQLEPRFNQLRDLKNKIFFAYITDKTASLYV